MRVKELSVSLPAYNEEGNIKKVATQTVSVLKKVARRWELLVVDDGSQDKTAEIVRRLSQKDGRIRLVRHKVNRGYGAALKTGFAKSRYSWVAFMDSDGQFDFSEIKNFLPLTKKADLILGYRLKRADSLARRLYTFGWLGLARILLGLDVRDYSCGFKLIKKKVFEKVQPLEAEEKVTQIEMLVKAKRCGFSFAEVGVHHYPRQAGQQTGADLKVIARSLIDLFRLWKRLH